MHAIFWGLKRAHHRAIYAVSRTLLRVTETRLTPARFDLLDLVVRHGGSVAQWRLVELLGVSGATISRMLKSLEKLKLVVRNRWSHDGRFQIVDLTREGRRRVKKVQRQLVDSGGVDRIVRSALEPPRKRASAAGVAGPPSGGRDESSALEAILLQFRIGFQCRALKRWPWVRPPERDSDRWLMEFLRSDPDAPAS